MRMIMHEKDVRNASNKANQADHFFVRAARVS